MTHTLELQQLDKLLASGQLTKDAAQIGTRLLQRINSPVRVVIFGLPGCGKSTLLNVLLGKKLISENTSIPTLEIVWGTKERMSLTLQDGAVVHSDSIAWEKIATQKPAFVKVELPLPILKKVSFLEVVSDGSNDDLTASLDWATRRTDIALWCSQYFSPAEQGLWSRVPDAIKDHSILALTKADILSSEGTLSDKLAELQSVAANEFHSMFPITALQSKTATAPDGSTDQAALNESGGKALHAAVMRLVEDGRQADLDSVLIFLNRYAPKQDQLSKPVAAKPPAVSSEPIVIPSPALPSDASGNAKVPDLENQWPDALQYLIDRGCELSRVLTDMETSDAAVVLDHCATTADNLAETFDDEATIEPAFSALQNDILETAETILLMQLENDEGPAADAVTLLLQLRRGMEAKLAA
ncbi:MAG: 50S ribosome-binding GTPase [Marinosulfonomonas sp.]|nr:50S ribosome-binding GTPase [Marinosulfonomonas sp.]